LRKRFCVTFDFELQAAATDDGLVLSLGQQHSFPLESVFDFIRPDTLREDLAQAALASPMFTNRWRWNATRSLALLRHEAARRSRCRSSACAPRTCWPRSSPSSSAARTTAAAAVEIPDHPLVNETMDNCLTEAMDVEGLAAVLDQIRDGDVRAVAIETVAPSPFSHEILNSNPYAYLDDAPLEERRARAVSLRQSVPELAGGLGALDPEAIAEVARQAWPVARDADELHDVLLTLGLVPREEIERSGWTGFADALLRAQRATWTTGLAKPALVAAERVGLVRLALPQVGLRARGAGADVRPARGADGRGGAPLDRRRVARVRRRRHGRELAAADRRARLARRDRARAARAAGRRDARALSARCRPVRSGATARASRASTA
jgi:ATP-dependent Lhr-like helicase